MTVAALYIDPRGPYPATVGPEFCWDADRDATIYAGPWPVIAHPACGPWSRLRHLYRGSEGGPELAFHALEAVRAFGGILEHPAHSRFWAAAELPRPGEPPDAWGGWTEAINQCDFGHVARKPTWLYCVGVDRESAAWRPPPREPTHYIGGGRDTHGPTSRRGGAIPNGIRAAHRGHRIRTPAPLAAWLVALAETANARP